MSISQVTANAERSCTDGGVVDDVLELELAEHGGEGFLAGGNEGAEGVELGLEQHEQSSH